MRKLHLLLVSLILFLPCALSAQDIKNFTFHTDSSSGNGNEVDVTGLSLVGVTITGSLTSDRGVTFEVADSIGTFTPLKCINMDTQAIESIGVLNGSTPSRFQCPVGGFKKLRLRISAGSEGTLSSVGLGLSGVSPAMASSVATQLPPSGSSSLILDIGDNGSNESVALGEIAIVGDTNNIFTMPSADKLLVDVAKKWPSSQLSDSLSTNGTNCSVGQFPRGVDAAGNAEDCTVPAGSGDVSSNTGVSVDGELSLFSSTTGKIIKRATGTGIPKITAGVFGFSTPGVDYVLPSGSVATATALAANGTNCPPGQFPLGVDASGSAEGCIEPLPSIPDTTTILTTTNVRKVSGKQNVPRRVLQTISANAFTINIDDTDVAEVPALTAGVTVNLSVGTGTNPEPYQDIEIVFLPTSTPQSITWASNITARAGISLPTSTTGDNNKFDLVKIRRLQTIGQWVIIAKTTGVEPGITSLSSNSTYTCPHLTSRSCEMVHTGAAGTITVQIPSGGAPMNGKQLTLKVKCTFLQTIALTGGVGGFIASPNVPITGITCPAAGPSWTAITTEYSDILTAWQVYGIN